MFARILQFRRPSQIHAAGCHSADAATSIDNLRAVATEAALASPFDTATVVLGNRLSRDDWANSPRRGSRQVRRCA